MKRMECNFCGSNDKRVFPPGSENSLLISCSKIVKCLNCGLVYADPQPDAAALDTIYSQDYYGEKNIRFLPAIESIVRFFRRRRALSIQKYKKGGKILDIGCGRGYFLECMERLGWNVFGTEISPIAARRAKEIFPRQVFIGDPLELTFQENDYDCISIYHVLEHTQKPKEIIEKTYRLLKPGGLLLVAVPNIDCLSFNLLRSNWFGFGLPQNNYYFSLGVLSREIQKAGFNISHVRHFSMEQDPFSLLQGVLNRFVGNDNGLYHSLHRGNRPKQNAMIRACIYSLAASLFIPCLVMAWIFSKLSDGATVEIYAFKPHSS